MSLHNFNSNTKSWKMYTNTLTSVSGDDLLVMPSYGKDIILEVSANNDIFFKKGQITRNFDSLISEASFNSLTSRVEYILQEISGSSALNLITSGISNDLLIKSYEGQDIILEVSGNSEIIFKRGDFSYNLDDLIGGGSQSSDYATYNILDITGKIIFTDNSNSSGTNGSGTSGGSSNIVLTSISGNIIPSINNTFKLGDVSKNWSNAYITDLSVTNINGQPYINNATYLIDYSNSSFSPLGQDLSGEPTDGQATLSYFGYSVALSQDGTIMGVTAPLNNGTGAFQGSARIYKYNDVSWVQLGQDIDGIEDGRYQTIINLSSDGTIAAISSHYNLDGRGRVRIFKYTNDTSWVQLGLDINGEAANAVNGNEEFGFSISLSGNGKIIAIGAPKNDTSYNEAGQVRVYSYIENDNSWNIIGTFNGFGFDNRSGRSVSLSSSGTILAISSPFLYNNDNLSLMPRVDIYEFNNNVWSPKGPTIYGSYFGKDSKFGNNIVLSKDGLILAINELYNPSNNNLGRVLTYKYNSTDNSWNKLGSTINIVVDSSNLDWEDPYIALSSDGTIIALGMAHSNSTNRGLVRLYKLINNEWIKVGPDILSDASEGLFGYGISLSGNGTIMAIGSPKEGSSSEGYVRVYKVNYSYNSVIQYYQFTNVKANNIDVTNIEISGNIVGNIIPLNANSSSLGSSLKSWSNAYIIDVSATNIDVSGNLNPLIANSSSLGSTLKPWGNAYIIDVSATNISVSENIILNICGGTITNINKLTAPASNYKITSTTRLYQEISGDISWNAVNGYYGLAKDAYPGLNPYSSGAKAVSNWTGRSQGVELNSWRTVCWSPELRIFVAVTNNGDNRVMTSTNGTSWTSISDGVGSNQWSSVCWSAELGIFVAVSYGNVMTSATGTSWTSISDGILNGEESNSWTSVCWSAELGIFVAVAFGCVMTSANGTSWTSISDGVQGNNWDSVCWSAELGIFVAVAYNGVNRIMTSANGTSWTSTSDGIELNAWTSVCWSAELGIFVAVAYNGDNRVMTSANGTSWTSTSDGVDLNAWNSVCWSAELGIFVAVARGGDNRVMYSANGTSWTSTSDGVELNVWNSVCWSAELGIFVAVAIFGEESDIRVMTSSLKGRPPTSYNVFDSTSNSIDENGMWTFSNISIVDNLVPVNDNYSNLGLDTNKWASAYIASLNTNSIGIVDNLVPVNDNYSNLGLDTNKWASAHIASLNTNSIGIVDNLVPVNDNYSNLGLDTNRWASAHIASLNTNSISIVDNIVPVADVYSNLGLETNKWNNAHIYSLNTNYLNTGSISIVDNLVPVNDLYSNLGLETNRWNNAYINALNVTETVTFGGSNLYVPSSFTIDPIGHGDNTGTVFINGNLVVQGVTTTINSSVLDISDKMIVFASKASNSLQADGAGFEISGANVNFLYNNSSASFRSSIGMSISGNVVPVTSTGSLGSSSLSWSNAYIRDVSTTNIEVSGNIVPLRDMSSNLGSSLKRWNNVFVDDLSVNKINGQAYSAGGGTSNIFTTSIKDISSIINVAQVGQNITAGSSSTTRSDWFGRQVAMSGNGECIIVASPYKVVSGFNGVGSIITYRYDVSNSEFNNIRETTQPIENSTNTWRQYAQEVTSPTVQAEVYFGWGLAISHNGKTIAVASRGLGTTSIYITEFGINYTFPGMIYWSSSATISAGGEKVMFQPHSDPSFIIISNIFGTGYVEVHNSNSNKTTWTRVGLRLSEATATVAGKITEDSAICISSDAKTIAYTVIPYGNPAPLEYVVIYSLSGTSSANWTWNRIATITNSQGAELGYGRSIAMSYDGLTLAINQPGYTVNSTLRLYGRVKVYRYINSSWTQLGISGSFISSTYKNLIFGSEISLSPEGNILTVVSNTNYLPYGANINPTEYVRAIMIYIYDASSNTWIKQGPDIIKTNDTILGPGIYQVWETQRLFSSLTVSSYLFGSSYSNNPVFRIAVGSWNGDAAVAQTNSRIFVRSYQYTITNSKKQSLLKFNAETTETGSITISGDLIPNVSPIIAMFPIDVLNFWRPRYGCNIGSTQYRWNSIWSYYMDAFLGSFTCILTTSDDRLKHNEVIINNGLDVIDLLTPKFYQKTIDLLDASYNGDLSGHKWSYESGLIAQELLQIKDLSFVVSGGDYYDTNNLLITQPYSVNYNNVFVYGLAAIKELHQKVKAQETSISTLQTALLDQQATINSLLARLQALETSAN